MISLLTLMRHSAVACVSPESFPDKINMLNPLKKIISSHFLSYFWYMNPGNLEFFSTNYPKESA